MYLDFNGERDCYSVNEFCSRHDICPATFYMLLKEGNGPKIIKVGARTLISRESAAEWRKRLEHETAANFKYAITG